MASTPRELQLDLTVFGNADVIETRVPRSAHGHLSIGDDVMVGDDSVEGRLYRVVGLSNGDRDVRLLAVGPGSIHANIAASVEAADWGQDFSRAGMITVALDEDGRMVEYRPDGTKTFFD